MAEANAQPIRNARRIDKQRINNDWEYLDQATEPNHPTTDQKFNLTHKSQGLNSTTIRQPKKIGTQQVGDTLVTSYRSQVNTIAPVNDDNYISKIKVEQPKDISPARRLRANRATAAIASWVGWVYMAQLFFAFVSLVGLAAAAGLSGDFAGQNNEDQGLWEKTKNFVISSIAGIANMFGASDIAASLFLAGYFIVLAIGAGTISTIYIQYTLARVRPLAGSHSSLKYGTLLLAMVGYAVPLLNLFPWIGFWIAAIWKYPR
ncbi:MAG: hypothetical protein H6779_02855 [Candidatus Nomurabacteria bacterium]|nr:hypothetical protein [Candidatus Nomurabacteria bacterium]USN87329.1 MAG: hypothetical protein H6779_02855 [Candidatus Nomurabacteria bacterium]